jgi:hypothetical protein
MSFYRAPSTRPQTLFGRWWAGPPGRVRQAAALVLGGVVWGSLFGTVCGAALGTVWGVFQGDVGLGLDGALLGCLCFAGFGAFFGLVLGLTGEPAPPREDQPEGGNSTGGVKEPPRPTRSCRHGGNATPTPLS